MEVVVSRYLDLQSDMILLQTHTVGIVTASHCFSKAESGLLPYAISQPAPGSRTNVLFRSIPVRKQMALTICYQLISTYLL